MKKYRLISAAAISLLLFNLLTAPLTAMAVVPGTAGITERPDTAASSSEAEPDNGEEDGFGQEHDKNESGEGSITAGTGGSTDNGGSYDADDEEDTEVLEDELLPASPSSLLLPAQNNEAEYSFCGYDFYYADRPLELEFGYEFDEYNRPPETVDLYLDGPEGT